MARPLDPEKLALDNRALRAENRRLKREAEKMQEQVLALSQRLDELRSRQTALAEASGRAEELLRWLRARMKALERELGTGDAPEG